MENPIHDQTIDRLAELVKEFSQIPNPGDQDKANLLLQMNEVIQIWGDDCGLNL